MHIKSCWRNLMAALALSISAPAWAEPLAAESSTAVNVFPASYFAEARPNTAMDMIMRLPGFAFDQGPQVRGFAGSAGNVIVDGERPTSKQDNLESILRRIPANQVERIELIHGGAAGVDMQGRTVLANIVRRKDAGAQVVAAVAYDYLPKDGREAPSVRLETTQRFGDKSFEASLLIANFFDNGVGSGPHTRMDYPGNTDGDICKPTCVDHLSAKGGGWQDTGTAALNTPLLGGKLRVNGLFQDTLYYDRETDVGTPASSNDALRNSSVQVKGEIGVHFTRSFDAKTDLELLAIQQGQEEHDRSRFFTFDDEHLVESNRLAESILRATLGYRLRPDLTLQLAGEGAYNVQHTRTDYASNGTPIPIPAGNIRVDETRGEGGVTTTWTPNNDFSLVVGLKVEASTIASRGDVVGEKSLTYAKPRMILTWSPTARDQLRLRAEREVSQLDFNAFVVSGQLNGGSGVHAGNPSLLPQDAKIYEIALEHKFWKRGDATATLRHAEISHVVDRIRGFDPTHPTDPAGFFDTPGNIGDVGEDDFLVDLTLPLDRLGISNALLKAQGTWRRALVLDPVAHQRRPQSQLHPFDGELHFSQDVTSLKSTWGADVYFGYKENYYRFNEIDRFHFQNQVTLFYEYKPSKDYSFRAEFNNITDAAYQRSYLGFVASRPSAPSYRDDRSSYVGPLIHLRVRRTLG
jgi:outer membrane receptor protein involved in Fe transport